MPYFFFFQLQQTSELLSSSELLEKKIFCQSCPLKSCCNILWDHSSSRQSNCKTHFRLHFEIYPAEVSLLRKPVTQNSSQRRNEFVHDINRVTELTALTNMGQHHNKSTEIVLNRGIMGGLPASGWTDSSHNSQYLCSKSVTKGLSLLLEETETAIMVVLWVPDGAVSQNAWMSE